MICDDEFFANNINASIDDVVKQLPDLVPTFRFVLITSLDSTTDMKTDKMIEEASFPHRYLGDGVVFEGAVIPDLGKQDGFFAGFDEIWCSKQDILLPRPKEIHFVGPYTPEKPLNKALKDWMRGSQCTLGFGDGIGLNYITTDKIVANLLEQYFTDASDQ